MPRLENLKDIIDTNLENLDISSETKNKLIQQSVPAKKTLRYRKLRFISIPAVSVFLICAILLFSIFGNNGVSEVNAYDLMENITPVTVEHIALSNNYLKSLTDFSIDLIKKSLSNEGNSLVSPVSAYLALGMTANGANGDTLKEFETLLGKYNLSIDDINKYSYSMVNKLKDIKDGEFNLANSIWFDRLNINKSFLQTNADYYAAAAYNVDLSSPLALKEINNWVNSNTGNLIDNLIDETDTGALMYLINTIYFQSEWQTKYSDQQVRNSNFMLDNGKSIPAKFMFSDEEIYIKDDMVQGFIKPYKDNKYSFVALLPNEGMSIDNYVKSLTGEKFLSLIRNKSSQHVSVGIPEFQVAYTKSLVEPLKAMGLRDCFDSSSANFRKMSGGPESLYISEVKQSTFIKVNPLGTKAGAATSVQIKGTGRSNQVILDRPFIYVVMENETGLPLFIGTMNNPQ